MKVPIGDKLASTSGRVIVMDGGTGSSLEDRGVDVRNALWSSAILATKDGQDQCRTLHREFIDAGAEIIIANTHNASVKTCRDLLGTADRDQLGKAPSASADGLLRWIVSRAVEAAEAAIPEERQVVVAAGIGSVEI